MARDFAAVNLAIWQDPDWRTLPADAKLLYLTLWTHPQLDRAGVIDWRPGRIAALIDKTWTADDVRAVADCLEARLFIVTDDQTEECLIRSWVRFDGLLKSPVMSVTFANEYAALSSDTIRGVIVHELHKLRERQPDLAAWKKSRVLEVLDMPSVDPRSRALPADPLDGASTRPVTRPLTPAVTPSPTHSGTVTDGGSADPSPDHPPTPSPTPSPLTPSPSSADAADEETIRDDVKALCDHLSRNLAANDVKHTVGKGWRDAARLLLDRDGRNPQEAHRLIDWATADSFWRTNILSMPKFREKYDQLRLKAQEGNGFGRPAGGARPGEALWDLPPTGADR